MQQIQSVKMNYNIEELQGKKKVVSAADIMNMQFDVYQFQEQYKQIFGEPAKSFLSMIYGSKGSGKSTYALEFADYFARNNFGKVVYFSLEEGISKSFQNKMILNNITGNIDISEERSTKEIKKQSQSYSLVIIDSVNTADLNDEDIGFITAYRKMYNTSFLLVLQATKGGDYKGDSGIVHDCDIVLRAENKEIFVEKNRYANNTDNSYKIKAFNQ